MRSAERTNDHERIPRAFTLIEILVVVGIVALIAAILFPVMSAARGRARETITVNNLKQIYVQTALYQAEHNGDGVLGTVYQMGLPPGPQASAIPLLASLLPPVTHPDARIVGRQYFPLYAEPEHDGLEPAWAKYAQSQATNAVLYIDPHFTRIDIPLTVGGYYKRKFFFIRLSGAVNKVERRGDWLSRNFWMETEES